MDHGGEPARRLEGTPRTKDGKRVSLADFITAFMPTGYMLAVAKILKGLVGKPLEDLDQSS